MNPRTCQSGLTYVELLVAVGLLLTALLGVSTMFVLGYTNVNGAGNTTMGLAAARQVLEDARRLPYANLVNLNGFDTDDASTLPASGPELEVARRWRYAVAGEGVGWSFTSDEKARWPALSDQGDALRASGSIEAVQISATITRITVSVSVPGRWRPIELGTLIADL
ncbi:MAG: type II secretion system protein [bacterium]|nr:type II secretion system protein [bacterium]